MRSLLLRVFPQPAIGLTVSMVAVAAVLLSSRGAERVTAADLFLVIPLVAGLGLSYKYPVHIQRGTKLCMGTVPLYLMATTLPPVLAALAAGAGVLAGTWWMRAERDLYMSDIATDAGRWVIVVLAASLTSHVLLPFNMSHTWTLVATAALLGLGDILTGPLLYYPMTHERPQHIMHAMVREGGATEVAQYLLGLLGALVAPQHAWAILLLLVPVVPLYLASKSAKETKTSTRQVLESMAAAVDMRDPYTGGHSQRVAEYTARILREMKMQGPEVDLIVASARVHDIGKIGIPDRVLLKDGKLSEEERALMETHPANGATLLARYPDFSRGTDIVRHHHERWDGKGYPDGKKGEDIPFGARIIAVADSFDAMTSDRPYRPGMRASKAVTILRTDGGQQWDPEVVQAFLASSIIDQVEESTIAASSRPVPSIQEQPRVEVETRPESEGSPLASGMR